MNNIKTYLNWVYLTEYRDQWRAVMKTVMNLRVS
jgi:hypothetical protein